MFVAVNIGARHLCRYQRMLLLSRKHSYLYSKSSNNNVHNINKVNHTRSSAFRGSDQRLVGTQWTSQVKYQGTLARSRTQPSTIERINELSDVVKEFKKLLNYNSNIGSKKLISAISLLNDIIESENTEYLPDKLGSIPNLGEVLLACCGSNMIYETPEKREYFAGQIWTYIKQIFKLTISHYNALLLVFIENNTQFDPSKILDELKSKDLKPNRVTYQRLLHRYCLMGDMKQALKILEDMKENNMEINETVFASLLTGYGNVKDTQSLSELLQLMRTSGIDPGPQAFVAYICAHINCDASDQAIRDILDEATKEEANFSVHDYSEILSTLVKQRPDSLLINDLLPILENSSRNTSDYSSLTKIVFTLSKMGHYKTASNIFWGIRHNRRTLLKGQVGSSYVSTFVSCEEVPAEFIMNECQALIDRGLNKSPYNSLFVEAANTGRIDVLELILEKMKSSKTIRCHYYWPLLSRATNLEELLNILKKHIEPDQDQEELFDTFAEIVWPKTGDTSFKEIFQSFSDLKFDKRMLFFSFLESSKSMENVSISSKIDDALSVVEDKVFDQQPMNRTLESLTAQKILRKMQDFDSKLATRIYITCALKFGVSQNCLQIMLHLLKEKNKEDLQRVIDATNRVLGESQALTELVIACIRSGHIKQADKIVRSSPNKISIERLDRCANYFISQKWTESMKNLVFVTKTLGNFDRDHAYHELLRLYDGKNMYNETLELCVQMQEDGYQPSDDAAKLIGSILERNNIEIPFTKVSSQ